ncbi:ATP-binding protein [Streptomyces sp. NPDC002888]|uniref:ATP-binding protein n=1 Tax=Streptomyces sp. NPDC002888 TaxID=3364668 RepID=UPI00367399D5
MDIDPTQPWGIAIDYAGRATLTEDGHTVYINVSDTSLSSIITPDPLSGRYPSASVTAQFTETGTNGAVLRGYGRIGVEPVGTDPVAPDQTAVPRAVSAAVADFQANTAAYVDLCAQWSPADGGSDEEPAPETTA